MTGSSPVTAPRGNTSPADDAMILDIDPSLCTGCLACELYCSLAREGEVNPELSRIQISSDAMREVLLPITCVPCEANPCIAACPEPGAIHKDGHGAVIIEEGLCTACGKCARACKIGAIRVQRLAGRGKNGRAVALKCNQCGGDPWCSRVCPTGAIIRKNEIAGSQAVFDRLLALKTALDAQRKWS
jgi:carbon-monoxide dehydrogenase iron sulfur subunit